MTNILVTGGSGFIGRHLIDRLEKSYNGVNISVVSRNEGKLIELKSEHPNINLIMGDISNPFIAQKATKYIDIVYHLAAFKHASHAETEVHQCIKTNVIGTMNLLEAFRGNIFTAMSTDKACGTKGVYGSTKRLMEKLIQEHEKVFSDIKYRTIRCGNILNSTGSVTALWKDSLLNGREIIVTDTNATRYFWTVDQVVDLILYAKSLTNNSQPIIPKDMKAIKIKILLQAMQDKYGKATDIRNIGLQPGENLHEKLTENGISSQNAIQYSFNEIKELI